MPLDTNAKKQISILEDIAQGGSKWVFDEDDQAAVDWALGYIKGNEAAIKKVFCTNDPTNDPPTPKKACCAEEGCNKERYQEHSYCEFHFGKNLAIDRLCAEDCCHEKAEFGGYCKPHYKSNLHAQRRPVDEGRSINHPDGMPW